MLYREPKVLKVVIPNMRSQTWTVSVLYREPKVLKVLVLYYSFRLC